MRNAAGWSLLAAGILVLAGAPGAGAQSSSSDIVKEALEGVQQDQARDSERVRRMVDEAVKGAEQAPSGQDTVNPTAPDALRPIGEGEPAALPVGYSVAELVGRPVEDGTGARLGVVRGLVLDETSGVARAMVEFEPLFGQPGKTSAVAVESLTTATARGGGFVMELNQLGYEQLPAYAWDDPVWRRVAG
jgi:hypothetical protein